MKLRKLKNAQARLAGRIADWERSTRTSKNGGKEFTKPGSLKK
jgi:hypothetical protein